MIIGYTATTTTNIKFKLYKSFGQGKLDQLTHENVQYSEHKMQHSQVNDDPVMSTVTSGSRAKLQL